MCITNVEPLAEQTDRRAHVRDLCMNATHTHHTFALSFSTRNVPTSGANTSSGPDVLPTMATRRRRQRTPDTGRRHSRRVGVGI